MRKRAARVDLHRPFDVLRAILLALHNAREPQSRKGCGAARFERDRSLKSRYRIRKLTLAIKSHPERRITRPPLRLLLRRLDEDCFSAGRIRRSEQHNSELITRRGE